MKAMGYKVCYCQIFKHGRPLKVAVARIVFQPGKIIFNYGDKLESPN